MPNVYCVIGICLNWAVFNITLFAFPGAGGC